MGKKVLFILVFSVICIFTSGCRSNQASTNARATRIAAEVFATQTAQVMMPSISATSLVTLTPTQTPIPSFTPTLSPTPSIMPTLTKTPFPFELIAFSEETATGIFVVNRDGTWLKYLLPEHYFGFNSSPAWSPDGLTIAFSSYIIDSDVGTIGDIWLVNPDGTELRQLTETDDLIEGCPIWSPNGNQIAFRGADNSKPTSPTSSGIVWSVISFDEIWVVNTDGNESLQVYPKRSQFGSSVNCPKWSPDGDQIAFSDFNGEIIVINSDGSNLSRLTDIATGDDWVSEIAWSPDGSHIAFSSGHPSSYTLTGDKLSDADLQIYVIHLENLITTQLTFKGTENGCPSWSPDGKQILFHSNRDGDNELYIMNADGSEQTRLLEKPWDQLCPVLQPGR